MQMRGELNDERLLRGRAGSEPVKDDPLIEVVASFLYRRDYPRRLWGAKSRPQHMRALYRGNAREFIRHQMGGEDELFAFCEAVLATRAASC